MKEEMMRNSIQWIAIRKWSHKLFLFFIWSWFFGGPHWSMPIIKPKLILLNFCLAASGTLVLMKLHFYVFYCCFSLWALLFIPSRSASKQPPNYFKFVSQLTWMPHFISFACNNVVSFVAVFISALWRTSKFIINLGESHLALLYSGSLSYICLLALFIIFPLFLWKVGNCPLHWRLLLPHTANRWVVWAVDN